MGLITLATLSFTACGDSKKADEGATKEAAAAPAADAPAATEKKETPPASKWPGKDKFIEKCSASAGIKDMSKGDAAKAKDMCSCLADKVEAKHPEGMNFEETGKPAVIQELGADKCFGK